MFVLQICCCSFLQDPSCKFSSKDSETDVSDETSMSSSHKSSQTGLDQQTEQSSQTVHKSPSTDSTQINANGPEGNSPVQKKTPDSTSRTKSHELQDYHYQTGQCNSEGSDKEAQSVIEGVSHNIIHPQTDEEMHKKDSVDGKVQEIDRTNIPLQNTQIAFARDNNTSTTGYRKEGIAATNKIIL